MDMYKRYGVLGAAGDRHLAEFMNNKWYLASPSQVDSWKFALTTVDFRIKQMNERIEESKKLASGEIKPEVKKSDEEAVELMRSVLGLTTTISNVNLPNRGQISWLPEGSIVETNAVFSNDRVVPVTTKPLPVAVQSLVRRCSDNIDILYEGIKKRDKKIIFESFVNQPLCSSLTLDEARSLFDEMYEKNLRFFQKNN
jgi:alpha-galactosidase/6-phospho-beta-glucosidase family protein